MSRHRRASPPTRAAAVLLLALLAVALVLPRPLVSPAEAPHRASPSPPQTLVLQPDAASGMDTFLRNSTSAWNFGDNASLWVGPDPSNGSLARSLLRFDVSALPVDATVVSAALELYQHSGGSGTVHVRRASAPWTEGSGARSWISLPITVRETAGVRRTLEPVSLVLSFPRNGIVDPVRDLRVHAGGVEVPSQVYAYASSGGQVTGARLVFGATVPAWGARTFTVTYSTNGTLVPAYRTKTFGSAPLWTSPPVGTGASGVSVVDLDGDGTLEVVYGTSNGYVYVLNATGSVRSQRRLSTTDSVPYTPQVADLDGDGELDVVVVTNDPSLVRMNSTLGVVWTRSMMSSERPLSTPTLLDVNGDGVLDVLVGRTKLALDAFDGVTGAVLRSYPTANWAYTASVLDVTGDGQGEIFFVTDDRLVHAYDVSGTRLWTNAPVVMGALRNSLALGDVNGDGTPEVVTGDTGNPGLVFVLNALNGSVVWTRSLSGGREGGQTLADLDGDGVREVIVGVTTGPLHALLGASGGTLWSYSAGTTQAVSPAVVDVTKDGRPEVIYMDRDTVVRVLDATGALVYSWTIAANDPGFKVPFQKAMATPAVTDLNGDGVAEVIVPTGGGVVAFPTGGLAPDWRTYGYNWNHTHNAWRGTSPDGAPFLVASVPPVTVHAAPGASWDFRDGTTRWISEGGDFGPQDAGATAAAGWSSWNVTALVREWHLGTYPNVGLFLAAEDESSGAVHGFHSSDASSDPSLRPLLSITYTVPVPDPVPQIVRTIPDVSRPEDSPPWTLDLEGFAADDDTPLTQLRWNVSGYNPSVVRITGLNVLGGTTLTFVLLKDAWGDMAVTYWLTDPQGNARSQRAWVNVTPVNDAPSFNPPSALFLRYDVTYTFDFGPYIADVDDPPSRLNMFGDDPVHASVSGFNVSFLYPISYLDRWVFVGLIVTDGRAATGKVVAVKVTSDDPPVLTRPLPDLTLYEGERRVGVFDLDDYFLDPNGDALFFSYGYSHLTIEIHANHSVDITAESNWNGVEHVTFRGKDPTGAIVEDTILVTVIPVDDPPVLGPVPDLVVRYDEIYTFDVGPYISDPDTPLEDINASASSPFVTVSGHLLTLLYPLALNGTVQDLTIWIGDGTTVVSRTIRVTVSDNWPPVLLGKMRDRTFLEDTTFPGAYDLSAFFADPDNRPLFYSSGNVDVLVSIDASGIVDLGATADWFGTERVTFRATDPGGALAEDTVWITVIPVNDAPRFRPIPTVYIAGTSALLDLSQYVFDVDNNASELAVFATSGNVTVVGLNLIFNYSRPGRESVELFVSDGMLTSRTSVLVVVLAPPGKEVLPAYLLWIPLAVGAASFVGFVVYRRRQIEWVFLVTNAGLLVSSVSTRGSAAIDTDLMTGMLTAIMDFAKTSFSDESQRELEGLELGDRKVAIVRGEACFLAAIYRGRAPGSLPRVMTALMRHIEATYPSAVSDIVDTATLEEIPLLLERLAKKAWWPFLSFR